MAGSANTPPLEKPMLSIRVPTEVVEQLYGTAATPGTNQHYAEPRGPANTTLGNIGNLLLTFYPRVVLPRPGKADSPPRGIDTTTPESIFSRARTSRTQYPMLLGKLVATSTGSAPGSLDPTPSSQDYPDALLGAKVVRPRLRLPWTKIKPMIEIMIWPAPKDEPQPPKTKP